MWAALGAIGGALIGSSSQRKTNNKNLEIMRETNAFNAAEAQKARRFNKNEVRSARRFDVKQNREARRWNLKQTLAAEKRARKANILAERRATKRQIQSEKRLDKRTIAAERRSQEYNDPAAQRARLEAAGINPLGNVSAGGMDPSGAGSAGYAASTMAQSQISAAMGATSGVASSPVAQAVAAQMQAYDGWGQALSSVGAAVDAKIAADQEQALRESQIETENARLTELLNRAKLRPIVGGVYGNSQSVGEDVSDPRGPIVSERVPDGALLDIGAVDAVASKNQIEEAPIQVGGGLSILKNDYLELPVVTTPDGEMMGIDEAVMLVPSLSAWAGFHGSKYLTEKYINPLRDVWASSSSRRQQTQRSVNYTPQRTVWNSTGGFPTQ